MDKVYLVVCKEPGGSSRYVDSAWKYMVDADKRKDYIKNAAITFNGSGMTPYVHVIAVPVGKDGIAVSLTSVDEPKPEGEVAQ